MTDSRRTGCAPSFGAAARRVCGVAVVAAAVLVPLAAATAQENRRDEPLAPPDAPPLSRLTITPSDFDQWLSRARRRPEIAAVPEESPPSLATAPPPPPLLVTPPPPPPATLAPPPAPGELPGTPSMAPASPGTEPRATVPDPAGEGPPAAPVLAPPEAPQVATLPPDSRDTTPVPAVPAPLPQPAGIRILYAAEATELPEAARKDLDALTAWLRANPKARLQIVGYASATTKTGSDARRRSLLRTLAVRTYLVENGVLSTRMDVRALGDRTDETPKDRVEVRLPPS
jgi:outer membrane protein OmpA-like peptidoglycan-associated protein